MSDMSKRRQAYAKAVETAIEKGRLAHARGESFNACPYRRRSGCFKGKNVWVRRWEQGWLETNSEVKP